MKFHTVWFSIKKNFFRMCKSQFYWKVHFWQIHLKIFSDSREASRFMIPFAHFEFLKVPTYPFSDSVPKPINFNSAQHQKKENIENAQCRNYGIYSHHDFGKILWNQHESCVLFQLCAVFTKFISWFSML